MWNHSDHRQWVKVFTKVEIKDYNKQLLDHLNNLKSQIEEKVLILDSIQEEQTMINSVDLGKTYLDTIELLRTPFVKKDRDLPKPGLATPRNNENDDPRFLEDSTLIGTEIDRTFTFQWLGMDRPKT